MYLFKTLKSLSKYSKQLTRSSQQLNAVPHQTININILQYDRNRTVGKDDNLVMEQVY